MQTLVHHKAALKLYFPVFRIFSLRYSEYSATLLIKLCKQYKQ